MYYTPKVIYCQISVRARIQCAADHAISRSFAGVVFIVTVTGAKFATHVCFNIPQNVTLQIKIFIVSLEPTEVVVSDKAGCQLQEIVTCLVQSIDILASLHHIVNNEGLLAFSKCFHFSFQLLIQYKYYSRFGYYCQLLVSALVFARA